MQCSYLELLVRTLILEVASSRVPRNEQQTSLTLVLVLEEMSAEPMRVPVVEHTT